MRVTMSEPKQNEFFELTECAHLFSGHLMAVKHEKTRTWIYYTFDSSKDIDHFLQELVIRGLGQLATSNNKTCKVLI
jgi:hypothetical protein